MEAPNLVFNDTICLMYYDYGPEVGQIGVAACPGARSDKGSAVGNK